MKIKCMLLGCKTFKHENKTHKRCKDCGTEYVLVKFYPNRPASWLNKEFLDHWKSYNTLVNQRMVCEACDTVMDKDGECGCNAC